MKSKSWAIALALLASPLAAHAAGGRVDLYGVPFEEFEIEVPVFSSEGEGTATAKEDGKGFGVKGLFMPADVPLLLTAEFQSVELDDVDLDINQYRGGIGWLQPVDKLRLGGYVEYVVLELESDGETADADGFGIHGRIEFLPVPAVNLHAQVGYLGLEDDDSSEDLDGYEVQVGAAYSFTDLVGVFADYRYTDLESDAADFSLSTVRTGVRLSFGRPQ